MQFTYKEFEITVTARGEFMATVGGKLIRKTSLVAMGGDL